MERWIDERLRELEQEQETGNQMLEELRARQATLEGTLQRIAGAIQVLHEARAQLAAEVAPEAPEES